MATDILQARVTAATAIAAVAALMAGCTVGPDFHRPDDAPPPAWEALPAADAASAPSRVVAAPFDGRQWWAVFHDPVLDALVDEAVAQNLDLQATALRIAEARAQRGATASQARPSVSGMGLAGRERMSENGIASSLGGGAAAAGGASSSPAPAAAPAPVSNLFQVGFDATWELDLWGKTRRAVEAADAAIRSAEQARGEAAVSLTAEVARTYLHLRATQRQRAIAWQDVADQHRLLALTDSRSRNGFASQADSVRQATELAAAEARLPPLDDELHRTESQLTRLLALPPGALHARLAVAGAATLPDRGAHGTAAGQADASGSLTAAGAADTDTRLPPEVPVGLPGELLRRRPDVLRAEADLHAATARIGVARAQLYPSITLGAFAGLQATHAADLTDWSSRFWAGGAQVSLPLFQGGRLKAQVRIADAQAQEAALAWRGTVLTAYHEADDAIATYALAQAHARALAAQRAQAARSRDLMQSRRQAGFVSEIEVIDAQRQLHQADVALSQATSEAAIGLVALFKALGGDWQDERATAATP